MNKLAGMLPSHQEPHMQLERLRELHDAWGMAEVDAIDYLDLWEQFDRILKGDLS